MVDGPGEYRWSNYKIIALEKVSELRRPHPEYLLLGDESVSRRKNYRALFKHHVDDKLPDEIRGNTLKGMTIGNDRFKHKLESLTGRRLKSKKRGRPAGWRKHKEI